MLSYIWHSSAKAEGFCEIVLNLNRFASKNKRKKADMCAAETMRTV